MSKASTKKKPADKKAKAAGLKKPAAKTAKVAIVNKAAAKVKVAKKGADIAVTIGENLIPLLTPVDVPLDKLRLSPHNVRKVYTDEALDELEAMIVADGLINPLLVEQADDGFYEVVAGGRRLKVFTRRAARGDLPEGAPIPCRLLPAGIDAREASLAENVGRLEMHPADEFEAFQALSEAGRTDAEIGQRFGVSETVVKKRRAVAENASPKIMEAFRAGEIDLAAVQAFAISDDHKRQEKVLKSGIRHSAQIRAALTEGKVPTSDKRVRFLGLEAIRAAGIPVTPDLFEDENRVTLYIEDTQALNDLYNTTLQQKADAIKEERWSWVQVSTSRNLAAEIGNEYERMEPVLVALDAHDKRELKHLQQELEALDKKERDGDTELSDKELERYGQLEIWIEEIKEKQESWPEKTREIAGVMIGVDHTGHLEIFRGLITKKQARKLDKEAVKAAKKEQAGDDDKAAPPSGDDEKADAALSAKVLEDLSLQRSSATSAALAQSQHIGFAAAVHALALPLFYADPGEARSCINIAMTPTYRGRVAVKGTNRGLDTLTVIHDGWLEKTPDRPEDLWPWMLEQPHDVLVQLLIYIAGATLRDLGTGTRHPHAELLRQALNLDMTQYFTPTVENLFGKMSKPQLLWAIADIRGGEVTADEKKKKKDDLAVIVAQEAEAAASAGKPWLPPQLRAPAPAKEGQ